MRYKRTGAAIMAAVMAASSMSICAFAAEDEAMKKELTYVKQRLDIPEKYTQFDHYTSSYNGNNSYQFTWSDPDDRHGRCMSVQITGKVITNIYVYDQDMYTYECSFAKMSEEKLRKAAKTYIGQINPDISGQIVIDDDSFNISLSSNTATLNFHREVNGVQVTGQTGTVTVNKDTGALMRYNLYWINGATFSKKEDAISAAKAKASYEKYLDSDLIYTIETEYDSDKQIWKHIPHLIYRQQSSGQINAFTGLLSTYEDYDYYGDDDAAMETAEADNEAPRVAGDEKAVSFTEEEIANLEKEASLITAEEALKKISKLGIFFIPESSSVTWQNCSYNKQEGFYIRNVSFSAPQSDFISLNNENVIKPVNRSYDSTVSGNFMINAETGEILSFYNYSQDTGDDLSAKEAKKKAENAMKILLGDKADQFGKLEQTSESHIDEQKDAAGKIIPGTPRTTQRRYSANREAYGIKCVNEDVNISVGNSGYITNYNVTYYADVNYPKPEKIISKSDAYKKFFKQVEFGLKYRCAYDTKKKKVVTALVYAADSQLCIDAFTGKSVNYDGSEIDLGEKLTTYKDLGNSKYKKYAEKLASYGITLMDKNGKLNENETVTAGEFRELISKIGYSIYDSVDKASVKLPKDSAKLTRRVAALLLVRSKYGYELPEMTAMYKSPFSDVKEGDKYVGYIAIAQNAGLLKGKSGKFGPTAKVTRGEALKIVYDILA